MSQSVMVPLRDIGPATSTHEGPLLTREERDEDSDVDSDVTRVNETSFLNGGQEDAGKPVGDAERDPFEPFDDLPEENRNILTVRAIAVGLVCGALVNASNIYLGLKSGWTASANIFGSIIGFTVLKSCAKYCGRMPILGGDFGPRENNIVQTVATATGGMSNVFVSAFPAMYQLNLMETPGKDFWRLTTLTAVGGYFGLFFGTPLRNFFVIQVARELHLIFPSSFATAITIRSMHLAAEGTSLARRKMRALSYAFLYAMVVRIISQYAVGIFWDWHPFTWLYLLTNSSSALYLENWGWYLEWAPAFIGSGMLIGLNVAISYFMGSVIAWGIAGPILVSQGLAFGTPLSDNPKWSGLTSYFSLASKFTTADHPSPRYWLLWPGVLCMIVVSFTELACQWKVFLLTFKVICRAMWKVLGPSISSQKRYHVLHQNGEDDDNLVKDPALPSETVKPWLWFPGLMIVLILTCLVMRVQYGMPIGESILAMGLAFFFSFLAIQATGATDITPLTAASKASQIILGATTRGPEWTVAQAQRLNLLGGALASIGASQAADLTGDFRIGFLLRTSPKLQWFAQGIGTLVAVFIAPTMFVLFARAYPCILSTDSLTCPFQVPSVSAWRAVAVAVTDPTFPIPVSSRWFSVAFATFGSAMVLIRHFFWIGKWAWIRKWHPNMMVIALAFIIPASIYGTAMLIGAIIAGIWAKKNPAGFEAFCYAVAAGLMAGEGIGGVVNAVLQILGVSGDVYGSKLGCPADKC